MRSPRSRQVLGDQTGMLLVRVLVGNQWQWITEFRGVPTKIGSITSADPFGPASAEIELPAVTSFDKPGAFDLRWLKEGTPIDIVWSEDHNWRWEGYIASIEQGSNTRVQCKGALYILDNYLAKPMYPTNPIPYETLIKQVCNPQDGYTGLGAMRLTFPEDWEVVANQDLHPSQYWMLSPWGLATGEPWTGLATRSTGSWDPSLTSFTQGLLATMYAPQGDQWTLGLDTGRVPHLKVREQVHHPQADTIEITNGSPGVQVQLSRDWSQSANVVYGTGSDLSGVSYSNMRVANNGYETHYDPFAYNKAVHPNDSSNPYWDPRTMRKEAFLTFTQGVDMVSAMQVAQSHLQRFSDPGLVGSITLESDPLGPEAKPINRYLIRAGQTIVVKGWNGSDVFLHITRVMASPEEGTVSLDVDSRYRDALTASEVYARTRDALDPLVNLQVGKARQSITVNDLVLPWSYEDGSGIMPAPAKDLFGLRETSFPWTDLTRLFPPRTHPHFYVTVEPDKKFSGTSAGWQRHYSDPTKAPIGNETTYRSIWSQAIPVRLAQNGQIRLSQIAAYNQYGEILPVEFHVALYNNTITVDSMPTPGNADTPRRKPGATNDRYPFFQGAFEDIKPTGELISEGTTQLPSNVQMFVGWGTYEEPAGYYPGLASKGGNPTGMLVDETSWSFSTEGDTGFNPYSKAETAKNPEAGHAYAMIYCDDTFDTEEPIHFLGRFWVAPQGAR